MERNIKSSQNTKILIVDDEVEILDLLERAFVRANFDVFRAEDGAKAFEVIKSEHIDCVLTDIRMPKCDGAQLLTQIKELGPSAPLVFVMTGSTGAKELDLVALGAIMQFNKPFHSIDVIKAIKRALGVN